MLELLSIFALASQNFRATLGHYRGDILELFIVLDTLELL